jgi:bifunctional UDP-N-acetylglucosamine pyrophosphorylase/glucosamine-1-phosphate N-acetyltransferase
MKLNIVILAAGQGKRMNSAKPKVLHELGGKPILLHVLETASKLNPSKLVVVYGHGGEVVKSSISQYTLTHDIFWVKQDEQLGTGHALKQALPYLDNDGVTLVLYGDVPLLGVSTLQLMLQQISNNVVMLTIDIANPYGYGRVVRDVDNQIIGIVEEKDANCLEKAITEINTGVYIFPNRYLASWLNQLANNNHQHEYYLTDVIKFAHKEQLLISAVRATSEEKVLGVNNKVQLEQLERFYNQLQAIKLMESGVTIKDKSRIEVRGELHSGSDCVIDVNCVFEGIVTLGNNVQIGAGCIIKNVKIYDNVVVKPYSIIEDAIVNSDCQIGPFARIRPGTVLGNQAHIGNFVEIKNSTVGEASKVNHLTYIGDAEIGSKVNVGAGSVTCNYDGKNKFKTIIADDVFVGSGTMMVAPLTIGKGSVIGAGSTITRDTPENELTVARAKQTTIIGWVKRNKKTD